MRVLIAGTDERTNRILERYLTGLGHEFEMVYSGIGCVANLLANPPELLILDQSILWGGSDGVLARMSCESKLKCVQVLIVAEVAGAYGECQNPPVIGHILKPITPHDLLRVLSIIHEISELQSPADLKRRRPFVSGVPIGSFLEN